MIKGKIDSEISNITAKFDEPEFQRGLQNYCYYGKNAGEAKEVKSSGQKSNNCSSRNSAERVEDDILLETENTPREISQKGSS